MLADRLRDSALIPARIWEYLDRAPLARSVIQVVPLTGDASDRQYFRAIRAGGDSFVLALHAAPFDYHQFPFVRVAALFRQVPLPVPEILDHDGALGVLALEDLGDVTLQAHVGAARPAEHTALYRRAVEFIEELQRRGAELASPEYPPYGVAFDEQKLTWELDFFVKHFIQNYRGVAVQPAVRDAVRNEWQPFIRELAAEPRALCHRDFHSRNLMVRDDTLYLIDFQDARLGPDTYDLASLLRDSYVDVGDEAANDLMAYFLALRGGAAGSARLADDLKAFRVRFDLMALQRNLKALGTFGYQTTARANPVYIQYIPRTLAYARRVLAAYPRFAKLRRLLAGLVEELG